MFTQRIYVIFFSGASLMCKFILIFYALHALDVDSVFFFQTFQNRRLVVLLTAAQFFYHTGLFEFALEFLERPFNVFTFFDRYDNHVWFAPRPQLVVSDGGDWTASVPALEFPYLQRIYGFYDAKDNVTNVHLPKEKHDFGPNKRNAVYDFFAEVFDLDKKMLDESKVTIEPESAMYSFGEKGELLPENAIRSFDKVAAYFDKKAFAKLKSDASLEKKAMEWVASLNLDDEKKSGFAVTTIYNHLRQVRDWHNDHPYTTIPAGINPTTGKPLTQLEREIIADSAMPKEVHERLMKGLRRVLTEEQVEQILDKYTVGKVAFTMKGYQEIVPDMTEEETAFILEQLKLAREQAVDYKSMKQISAIFKAYKTKIELYFYEHGRNWRQMYKDYAEKRKAEKAKEGK